MLEAISAAMAARTRAAATRRAAGQVVPERPARIHVDRAVGMVVWYLDDGALALYRLAGGVLEPDARLDELPATSGLMRALSGRYYAVD